MIAPPSTINELLTRAQQMAGRSLHYVAEVVGETVPDNLRRQKGWVGQLLELALGANAGTKAEPDFVDLGVELKTVPIDRMGKPRESTFVSTVPLLTLSQLSWESSLVRKKLAQVLWVPVEAEPTIPLGERRIGAPIFWQPNPEEEAILRQDWQQLADKVALGQLEDIRANLGQYLHMRPKGANAKSLGWAIGPQGHKIQTLPRGFYLRPEFTQQILKQSHAR